MVIRKQKGEELLWRARAVVREKLDVMVRSRRVEYVRREIFLVSMENDTQEHM